MNLKGFIGCAMLLLAAPSVWAQDSDQLDRYFFPPELVMQHQQTLGLTTEQKETIKAAIQAAQAQFTDLQWELHDAMETMMTVVKEDRVAEQQALDQLEKILALEHQVKRAHLGLIIRIKNALTPEQQKKLREEIDPVRFMISNDDDAWPW